MQIDLKFIKSWGAYNAGEIARFVGDQARVLIDRGVALEHQAVVALEKLAAQAPNNEAKLDGSTVDGATGDQAKVNQKTKPNAAASTTNTTT